ncbi:MAG: hypothetical protein COW30_04685 [Rhodospirillales bacterium CG15_BIG_FIL_POST_REV_8_21_14_020_66_15]|nr:MAG: hypothetical protein COW30_04685 [Rhodospirillales bacterium CG15_BIG_FIL_POST_REV_8_21_14_020_66_15]
MEGAAKTSVERRSRAASFAPRHAAWTEDGVTARWFQGANGGREYYISVQVPEISGLEGQISRLVDRYGAACETLGLTPETAVFRRVFLSDVMNQIDAVRDSALLAETGDTPVAVSIVQQAPSSGAKIALLAYHVEGPDRIVKRRLSRNHVVVEKSGLRHLWSTRLCSSAGEKFLPAGDQTEEVFENLSQAISGQNGTLRENCVRTWVYVKGIDTFYQDMVDSRRNLFARHGMTRDTHYIASTGIEGACAHRYDLVAMDAYSVLGLGPDQVSYLNDFDKLCPTIDYNVTFERGTRVAYADRAHNFISGTASIDNQGRVVHCGDVMAQLDRALVNIDGLLRSGSSRIEDMMHMTVYLRDPADHAAVDGYMKKRFPDVPVVIVQGPVCRPEWLIEIEGIAIAANDAAHLPEF